MDEGIVAPSAPATAPEIMAAPAPTLRRDARVERAAAALPTAGAVARVHTAGSFWSPGRTRIIAAVAILLGIVYLLVTLLSPGSADTGTLPWSAAAQGQEGGGRPGGLVDDHGPAALLDLDDEETPDAKDDRAKDGAEGADPSDGDERSADEPRPGASDPGSGDPGTTPTNPGTTPTNPGTTPTNPGTTPTTPPPPPPPPAPDPLAFVSVDPYYAVSILGVKVLGGYTVNVTGEPGATASVKYGSTSTKSVTFDGSGRASASFGSVLDLGLSNPLIRVSYSDGTAGAPIEGYRDSL